MKIQIQVYYYQSLIVQLQVFDIDGFWEFPCPFLDLVSFVNHWNFPKNVSISPHQEFADFDFRGQKLTRCKF